VSRTERPLITRHFQTIKSRGKETQKIVYFFRSLTYSSNMPNQGTHDKRARLSGVTYSSPAGDVAPLLTLSTLPPPSIAGSGCSMLLSP